MKTSSSLTNRVTQNTTDSTEREAPIAETFHSLQGEGLFQGTPMLFVRLAGCNVGTKSDILVPPPQVFNILGQKSDAKMCTLYDGRSFFCDTDYQKYDTITVPQVMEKAGLYEHICFTGGEPLLHRPFLNECRLACLARGKAMHLETSGTIYWDAPGVWISCSPKMGAKPEMIRRADEIKLLISAGMDWKRVPITVMRHPLVYLQPINGVENIDDEHLKMAQALLVQHPQFRLSMQLHKILRVR